MSSSSLMDSALYEIQVSAVAVHIGTYGYTGKFLKFTVNPRIAYICVQKIHRAIQNSAI